MPKIRSTNTKGLIQESGQGATLEQGQLTLTRDFVTATVDTANGSTTTDLGISLPSGCRILHYKIEVLKVTSVGESDPAGNITDLGFKAGDVDAIADGITLDASAVGSAKGYSATLGAANTANATPTTELMLTHTDPGGAGLSSRVRVTVLYEIYS